MRFKLTPDQRHYEIELDSGKTVTLSFGEIDQLGATLDHVRSQLRQSLSRGASPIATTRITEAIVSIDMHHTEVILRLKDRGFEHSYTLAPDTAQSVRDGITYQLEGIEQAKARRTNQ